NSGPTADIIAKAEAALRTGNALLCYDLVDRLGRREAFGPELSQRLDYLAILSLAHCGSTQRALDRYHSTQKQSLASDQDWLALEGRLFKDLARQGGAGAQFMYARAAESYWQAFRQTGGYFSAINAATMFMLSGDAGRAQALAREVLAQTADLPGADELERYNLLASQAEAALLLEDQDTARRALRSADTLARSHRTSRARTVQQLQLICQHLRLSKTIPAVLTVPPQLFVYREQDIATGELPPIHPRSDPHFAVPGIELDGASAHVALLDPVDLCVVEQLIDRGVHVSLAIPGSREALSADWHARYEAGWTMRLARMLERAGEIHPTRGFLPGEARWQRQHVVGRSLGLSRHAPDGIRSQWLGLIVEPVDNALRFGLKALDTTRLRAIERALADRHCPLSEQPRQAGMKERRLCALLVARFGDEQALDDADLARLRTRVFAPLAQQLATLGAKVLLRRSQGLSLLLALDDPQTAARCAAAVAQIHQDALGAADTQARLPQEMRLLIHMAPVTVGADPLDAQAGLFGTELAFCEAHAARVPPGGVFVTEAFVAAQGLSGEATHRIEYVGESLSAATTAAERLFNLRPATP
ncbi:MAG TPA: tetratricopeptide repeat-containing protein, partial [Fontimonas sp.]